MKCTRLLRLLALLFYDFTCTVVGLWCIGDEYELTLTGPIIGRRLRPISQHAQWAVTLCNWLTTHTVSLTVDCCLIDS